MLTVQDLKAHLNITDDIDDDLLASKIAVASAWVAEFTGGPVDDDDAPEPLKEAVRQLAGHLYANREATLVGVTANTLPFGLMDLITPYRAWAF